MGTTKICSTCKMDKDRSAFYKEKHHKDGVYNHCKICYGQRSKVRYTAIKSERTAQILTWRKKNPDKIRSYSHKAGSIKMETVKGRLDNLWRNARARALKKSLEFSITLDGLEKLWENQSGRCTLTNIKFELKTNVGKNHYAPSIDRIDSAQGYTPNNVRLVTWQVNMALSTFGTDLFDVMCSQRINMLSIAGS